MTLHPYMPNDPLDLGDAVTDHGPFAGQLVHKVVLNPSPELVERARSVDDARDSAHIPRS